MEALPRDGGQDAADAIMTTDTVAKTPSAAATAGASAAWPRAPACSRRSLATMLVVLTTDAVVPARAAGTGAGTATGATFERVDSDGCLSTNDTVIVHGQRRQRDRARRAEEFTEALTAAATDLAMQLLADAEGSQGHRDHRAERGQRRRTPSPPAGPAPATTC